MATRTQGDRRAQKNQEGVEKPERRKMQKTAPFGCSADIRPIRGAFQMDGIPVEDFGMQYCRYVSTGDVPCYMIGCCEIDRL